MSCERDKIYGTICGIITGCGWAPGMYNTCVLPHFAHLLFGLFGKARQMHKAKSECNAIREEFHVLCNLAGRDFRSLAVP